MKKIALLMVLSLFLVSCNPDVTDNENNNWVNNQEDNSNEENNNQSSNIYNFNDSEKEIRWNALFDDDKIIINWEASWLWFFEADFSVELYQWNQLINETVVTTEDDWMTEDYISMNSVIDISELENRENLKLVFKKANPSWLEENAMYKEVELY